MNKSKTILLLILIITVFSVNSFSQTGGGNLKIKDSKISLLNNNNTALNNISVIQTKKQNNFRFSANLYLWTASLNGSSALPVNNPYLQITQTPEVNVNLKFSDALKNLKFGFMLAGKFMYLNAGILYDIEYMKLQFTGSVPVASNYIGGTLTAKQFLGDFALVYNIPLKNKKVTLSALVGTRFFSMNNTIDLTNSDNSIFTTNDVKSWADVIIGADAKIDFSKHWLTYIKGDVGGFGLVSKLTSSILWTVGYKITENWNTTLGFKYLYTNYDKNNFLWKMSQYGMLLSFGYVFN